MKKIFDWFIKETVFNFSPVKDKDGKWNLDIEIGFVWIICIFIIYYPNVKLFITNLIN